MRHTLTYIFINIYLCMFMFSMSIECKVNLIILEILFFKNIC